MKKYGWFALVALGIVLLGIGLVLLKISIDPQGILKPLPYLLIGLGCGVFAHGTGNIFSQKVMEKYPDIQKQITIEKKDERNIAVTSRAKSKAYDMMVFLLGALMLCFALMNVDTTVILLLVFSYLFIIGYGIYYRFKYDKEM